MIKENSAQSSGGGGGSDPLPKGFDAHLEYFRKRDLGNDDYWQCFHGRPDFDHRTVVDVGCGHGGLCIDVAVASASSRVIGVDLNAELIDFARWNLHANYPALESRVEFHCVDLRELPVYDVDIFLSKASFEHILGLADVLAAIQTRLKPGGKLYTGFSPLYHSPFGGHGRIHKALPFPKLPWGHLLLSERYLLRCANRQREQPAASIAELGLNQLSVDDFRRLFEESGLRILTFETNLPGKSRKAKVMNALSHVKLLRKYMIYSISAILEKPGGT
jgi:SAM-dependent methyltransferase